MEERQKGGRQEHRIHRAGGQAGRPHTSGLRPQLSNLGSRTSGLLVSGLEPFGLGSRAFWSRVSSLLVSGLEPRASDLWPRAPGLRSEAPGSQVSGHVPQQEQYRKTMGHCDTTARNKFTSCQKSTAPHGVSLGTMDVSGSKHAKHINRLRFWRKVCSFEAPPVLNLCGDRKPSHRVSKINRDKTRLCVS